MARTYFLLALFFGNIIYSHGQEIWNFTNPDSSACYALQALQKGNTKDSVDLNPFINYWGALIIKNGVYDFNIDGKKYWTYKVDSITSTNIYISKLSDSTKTFSFNLKNFIELVVTPLNNGRVGSFREFMSSDEYTFRIISNSRFCMMPEKTVCIDNDCKNTTISKYRFMIAGSKGKPIFYHKNKWYMRDQTVLHKID